MLDANRFPRVNEEAGPAPLYGRAAIHLKGDAAERNRSARALRASELRYRRVFETAPFGILVLDAETGVIIDANPSVAELLGYRATELVDQPLWSVRAFRNVAASKHHFRELLFQEAVRYDDLPLETRGGGIRHVELVSTLYLADGRPFVQCAIRDITSRVREEQGEREAQEDLVATIAALREADPATRDEVTGLLTSGHLEEALTRELHRARRGNLSLTVALLEVDAFDRVVQVFGRAAADALLREVGRLLREQLRKSDLACRYSGGSGAAFALVLPQSAPERTLERLEELRRAVRGLELRHDGRLIDPATLSAGVVNAGPSATSAGLLARARSALTSARREGGDRIAGHPEADA
ncbi:MAG: sensor domain-containing diguanylate cyclase [Gemmatimonadales bacterium]